MIIVPICSALMLLLMAGVCVRIANTISFIEGSFEIKILGMCCFVMGAVLLVKEVLQW